jgi:activating signal cointegrator complex subunit 3
VVDAVRRGAQAMVFVHSRKETAKTARTLLEIANQRGEADLFSPLQHPMYGLISREAKKSRNRELTELFEVSLKPNP